MAKRLVVFAGSDPTDFVQWRILDDRAQQHDSGACSLEDLPTSGFSSCYLVLPGDRINTHLTTLSAKSERQLRAAAPFAIEDDVASDLEDLHLALGPIASETGIRIVQAIDRQYMSTWLDAAKATSLSLNSIVADHALLSNSEEACRCIQIGGRSLINYGFWSASIDNALKDQLTLPAITEAASVLSSSPESQAQIPEISDIEVDDPLSYLSEKTFGSTISLMQGEFEDRHASANAPLDFSRWRISGILVASVALLLPGLSTYEGVRYRQETQNARTETESIFKAAFPDVTRVVNPRAQLRAQLGSGGSSGSDFLALNSILTSAIEASTGVDVHSIRYDGQQSQLQASISFSAYSDLAQLKEGINGLGGQVEEGGSRQSGGRRLGEITVTRK